MDAKTFGQVLRRKRRLMNITQAYLAALVNTGTRFISDLENGKPTARLGMALMVADALNIEFEPVDK